MRTGAKVAVALGAAVLGVAAPVAFVAQGAGAPGRADSPELWWERVRRAPEPVLASPERASAVQAGGIPVARVEVKAKVEETRRLPVQSPVVAIAGYGEAYSELLAAATFDDGVFVLEQGGTVHRVEGVQAVNALAFGLTGDLVIASDDGAFVVEPGGRVARKVASGAFSAVAVMDGVWLAGRSGLVRLGFASRSITRWGPDQGVRLSQPTSLAKCGERDLCAGSVDGLRKFRLGPQPSEPEDCDQCQNAIGTPAPGHLSEVAVKASLPEPFVTAVARNAWEETPAVTWAGTFGGGLVRLGGSAPLTPLDGLPEGRVNPRALAVMNGQVYAGTPAGLLVVSDAQVFARTSYASLMPKGRTAALVPAGGEVMAVAPSGYGGVWLGLPGKVVRMSVEFPSEPSALAQSRNP